jgi:predicted  nucleic acid-binding Zn-ribbon protein
MDIKEELNVLIEICRQDLKLVESRNELARLNKESAQAEKGASELDTEIEKIKLAKAETLKRKKTLDERLQLEKANLRKWEGRAEKIKGEREYTALMSEISTQKRSIFGIEAEMSEVNEELKKSDEKLNKASNACEEKRNRASSAHSSVKELLDEEESRMQEHRRVKEALLASLSKPLQARYTRIFVRKGDQAIAILKNEVCQACMRLVPPELYLRIFKGEVIEQCPSCQRILVIIKPADSNL